MAKKKHKSKQNPDPFALAPVPKREPNGRTQRTPEQRDPSAEARKARCRQMGRPITPETMKDARQQWWGCYAGRVIADTTMTADERSALWDAIQHMRRVITDFDRTIGAPNRHATCLRLLVPTEPMETDASEPPRDERTDREKQDAATSALMRLETWLGYTDKPAASEAKRVVWDDVICVDPGGLLSALRCVSDGLKGRKLKYRGHHG